MIIFDELTDYPDIATSLKSFNIDRRFDVICSGSMLGINYKKIHSNSVGNKIDYEMHSMDFEEFLWANGYSKEAIGELSNHFGTNNQIHKSIHNKFEELFREFMVVGGMPEVVLNFFDSHDLNQVRKIQKRSIKKHIWRIYK